MFSNLFMYFGPMWSAVALFAVVLLPLTYALVETLRLVQPASRRPGLPLVRLDQFRQRLVHSFAMAHAGNVEEVRRALLRASAAVSRGARRR